MVSEVMLCDGFEVVSKPGLNELFRFHKDQSVSNSDESTVTTEEDNEAVFSGDSPPSDAAEEWPSTKPLRSFYFVKQYPCNDPEIKAMIADADKEIYHCNVARIQISDALKSKRAERSALLAQMESLKSKSDGNELIFDERKREFEPLEADLGKRQSFSGSQPCSSEDELDDLIYSMNYRIEHDNISLSEETQLLQEIKQLEGIREKSTTTMDMNEVYMDREAVAAEINRLSEKMRRVKMETELLDAELAGILDRRDKAFERIKMLRRQRDLRNAAFYLSLPAVARARELAASGNVKDLEELANAEVEKFMSLWNADKAFRDDYEGRVSASLDQRQMSRDGRIKDTEEDLLVALEALRPLDIRTGGGVAQAPDKWGREDSSSCSSRDGNVAIEKTRKVERKAARNANKFSSEESDCTDLDIPRYQKPQMEEEMDEETLKEKKRKEELEKARQAMERKRKLQEKAAAKAAIRAQKEEERKLKEREKKAKKKAAASSSPSEQDEIPEAVTEMSEPETAKSSALVKEKRSVFPKQRSFRYRHRGRGAEALPKAILKRRRAYKFWVWAASSFASAFALFVFAFFYIGWEKMKGFSLGSFFF